MATHKTSQSGGGSAGAGGGAGGSGGSHTPHAKGRRSSSAMAAAGNIAAAVGAPLTGEPQPSLFDFFYEELLTQLMNSGSLADQLPDDFMRQQTDIDRVEYLMGLRPFVREFEIPGKVGVKSLEKSTRYREEGNRLFQSEQATQAILFYNKALAYAPHPDHDTYQMTPPSSSSAASAAEERHHHPGEKKRSPPSKYEALSFCYANRSAALRKLGQYDDCLRDVARAARFGYPRENIYKLWERKAKCYQGMRRYEMAVKCFRQAVQALKESTLSDNQKTLKSHEIQGWIRDLRAHLAQHAAAAAATAGVGGQELAGSLDTGSDKGSDSGGGGSGSGGGLPDIPLMGATGPIVIVPDPVPRRKASTMTLPPPEPTTPIPPKPERRSFRRKKTLKKEKLPPSPLPTLPNGGGGDSGSLGGGSGNESNTSLNRTPSGSAAAASSSSSPPATAYQMQQQWQTPMVGELQKANSNSQMSISQLSTTGIKPEMDVPDLSYGLNLRMPSASCAIDLRFSPEKGRFFVALQDLRPGTGTGNRGKTTLKQYLFIYIHLYLPNRRSSFCSWHFKAGLTWRKRLPWTEKLSSR